jgi:hypothetical protein
MALDVKITEIQASRFSSRYMSLAQALLIRVSRMQSDPAV